MENENNNILSHLPVAAAATEAPSESEVSPGSEAVEVAVGTEEKPTDIGDSVGDNGRFPEVIVAVGDGGEAEFVEKRKRGRPRKQPTVSEAHQEFMVVGSYSEPPQKRGRGRPKGSGKWQTLAASFGGSPRSAVGSNFTPYVIPIQTGENIVQALVAFSQCTPDSLCILSANGTISLVDILQPCLRGNILRYEGRFEIVSLKGSHTYCDNGGQRKKNSLLSVQFVNPEGTFYGGAVAGSLIAAGPTQLVVATFKENWREHLRVRQRVEHSKLNRGAATLPLQQTNGNVADSEVHAYVPAVPAVSPANGMSGPPADISPASLQLSDWNNNSQPSSEFVTQEDDEGVANP